MIQIRGQVSDKLEDDYMIRDDLVTHEQYAKLFDEMHPGFFERDYICNMTED